MPATYDLIRQAITEKKQIIAVYDGLPREMCPHVLGTNKKGYPQCLFYQFAGESSRGIFPLTDANAFQNWRCLDVGKLSDVQIREGEWYSISRHTRPQTCVAAIDIEVSDWQ
jgi:hypothetical protein